MESLLLLALITVVPFGVTYLLVRNPKNGLWALLFPGALAFRCGQQLLMLRADPQGCGMPSFFLMLGLFASGVMACSIGLALFLRGRQRQGDSGVGTGFSPASVEPGLQQG